jgi:hypothetical protein
VGINDERRAYGEAFAGRIRCVCLDHFGIDSECQDWVGFLWYVPGGAVVGWRQWVKIVLSGACVFGLLMDERA